MLTKNQKIRIYQNVIKCFEAIINEKHFINFKINQYKSRNINLTRLGICFYLKKISENKIYI